LAGAISPQQDNLANLQTLRLDHNRLSGNVPSQLGSLPMLQDLLVGNNPRTGELPRSLMNLSLSWLSFDATSLCEPGDSDFRAWLGTIADVRRTDTICRSQSSWRPVTVTP
jgi:hypothetical protein